jgi:hypothetical protein
MRHLRMIGLCLVAVFAIASVAATSASALPEWGQCFKKGPGSKYTDANCQKKSTLKTPGEFEWRKSTEVTQKQFTGAGAAGTLSTTFILCEPKPKREPGTCASKGEEELQLPVQVECETESANGEASGSKEVKNVAVIFKGCKSLGSACSNTPTEGEIRVNPLKGALGYISKLKKEVGVLLTPAKAKGDFAVFTCAAVNLTVTVGVGNAKEGAAYSPETTGGYDGIISPVTPVNQMTAALTQVYAINGADENIPSKFEGKHIDLLEDFTNNPSEPAVSTKWSKAGESITNVNHQRSGEEVEIKA